MARLVVCLQCRRGQGLALHEALAEGGLNVEVVGARCLGACDRGCVIALQQQGRHTMVLADLSSAHAPALRQLAAQYARSEHGWIGPRDRPAALQHALLLRLPGL